MVCGIYRLSSQREATPAATASFDIPFHAPIGPLDQSRQILVDGYGTSRGRILSCSMKGALSFSLHILYTPVE